MTFRRAITRAAEQKANQDGTEPNPTHEENRGGAGGGGGGSSTLVLPRGGDGYGDAPASLFRHPDAKPPAADHDPSV